MSIFDIVGPVMVGPSSSHTAGAVRIGYICYKLMDEPICKVEIGLYGSFLATGKGHGTDKALVAGLLGMKPDDIRVPQSFELAKEAGMDGIFVNWGFRGREFLLEHGAKCVVDTPEELGELLMH